LGIPQARELRAGVPQSEQQLLEARITQTGRISHTKPADPLPRPFLPVHVKSPARRVNPCAPHGVVGKRAVIAAVAIEPVREPVERHHVPTVIHDECRSRRQTVEDLLDERIERGKLLAAKTWRESSGTTR
jgi:hypothetical protein